MTPHVHIFSGRTANVLQENDPGIAGVSGSGSFFRQGGKGGGHGAGVDHPAASHNPIAAFAASGDTEKLKGALEDGLSAGLSVSEIKEVLIQLYAYAGFPRSLTALNVFRELLEARKASGITDKTGPAPHELPPDADRLAVGAKIQTELVGRAVSGPIYEFAPAMDKFLKEHLFCDIFSRNILSWQDRELATISILAALPAPAQLASHLRVCRNIGLTAMQLKAAAAVLKARVSEKAGALMDDLLAKMASADSKKGK